MLAYVLPRLLPQHKSVIMGWYVKKVLPKKKAPAIKDLEQILRHFFLSSVYHHRLPYVVY